MFSGSLSPCKLDMQPQALAIETIVMLQLGKQSKIPSRLFANNL
jgi:hypothetical protein